MALHKRFAFFLTVLVFVFIIAPSAGATPTYNDVSISHPAYSSIIKIAQKGILVSDASGNYRPDDLIDKFETAKILAGLAGYKQIDYTPADKDFYDRAYDKNKSLISQYGKNFKKWKTSTDREIAFLIEKEILTPEDLNQFVILRNGEEVLRALSKEEAAVFLVKLMDKKIQALSTPVIYTFADDLRINAAHKPYVYFMRSAGIINPDDNGNFNPKQALTRAEMAVLLDRVLNEEDGLDPDKSGAVITVGNVIETVTGTFDKYFENETNAIQIIKQDGEKQLYKMSDQATVFIDGFLKKAADLKTGMPLTIALNNFIVTDVKAGISHQPAGTADDLSGPVRLSAVEGKVVSFDILPGSITKTINLEIKIEADSLVMTDVKSYAVQDGCRVTRAGTDCALTDIQIGDICRAEVYGAKVYSINLEDKERDISGTLLNKKSVDGGHVFVIRGASGVIYELTADSNTEMLRENNKIDADSFRAGDIVNARAEYERLLRITASSTVSSVTGTIEAIRHTRSGSVITILPEYGETAADYPVVTESVDITLLNVGAKVKIFLESAEAYAVFVEANDYANRFFTGEITVKRGNNITLIDSKGKTRNIVISSETIVIDSATGDRLTSNYIREGYTVFVRHDGETIKNVTIQDKNVEIR